MLPGQALQLGLDDPAVDPAAFVHDLEVGSWHLANNPSSEAQASRKLLGDKLAWAQRCGQLGIPVVSSLDVVPAGSLLASLEEQGVHAVFCKLRDGNRGLHAFAARRTPTGWVGRGFDGTELASGEHVEAAWAVLRAAGEPLVQPLLGNHAELAAHATRDEAITVRLITLDAVAVSACLEVPEGERGYRMEEIDTLTGRLSDGTVIPDWAAVIEGSVRGHRDLALRAVAWDWVITGDGAVMLEGNSGFSMVQPQRTLGPLLAGWGSPQARDGLGDLRG